MFKEVAKYYNRGEKEKAFTLLRNILRELSEDHSLKAASLEVSLQPEGEIEPVVKCLAPSQDSPLSLNDNLLVVVVSSATLKKKIMPSEDGSVLFLYDVIKVSICSSLKPNMGV